MKITREKAIGISSAVMIAFVVSLLFMIMGSPLAAAVPPVTQIQSFTEGYVIEGTPQEFIKQNTAFQYNFFVYDISNGKAVTSSAVECIFYMATDNGTVTAFENATYFPNTRHWGVLINKNNFSSVGHHPFGVKCNSTLYGGAKVSYFTVTSSGVAYQAGESYLPFIIGMIIVIALFVFIAIFFKENKGISYGSLFLALMSVIAMVGILLKLTIEGTGLSSISNIIESMYNVMLWILRIAGFALVTWVIVSAVQALLNSNKTKFREKASHEDGDDD